MNYRRWCSDSCLSHIRLRSVPYRLSDAHRMRNSLAGSISLVIQLPEPSSCSLHPSLGSVDRGMFAKGAAPRASFSGGGERRWREGLFYRSNDHHNEVALFVGQSCVLLSESNEGATGTPKLLDVCSHTLSLSFTPTTRD